MTFLVWRVLAQTSPWSAHGRPSETWSSAIWLNMGSSKSAASCLPFTSQLSTFNPFLSPNLVRPDEVNGRPPTVVWSPCAVHVSTVVRHVGQICWSDMLDRWNCLLLSYNTISLNFIQDIQCP
ncbi:hypothetical protein DPEC_G00280960 [Dallia pectoralis]|uniref:Uncharacterized protein n=1 Tax=Dallia pectoralis TaxID=75939 RepID=A0ACC2FMX6_DALPE|nr:hypothetical protein DPEC_G00280960 [Dallia pectoralis]